MESVLNLISVNGQNHLSENVTRNQESIYPFRICDLILPTCKTGFVYFLISNRRPKFNYIGTSKCIQRHVLQDNLGFVSNGTTPIHLRLYADSMEISNCVFI